MCSHTGECKWQNTFCGTVTSKMLFLLHNQMETSGGYILQQQWLSHVIKRTSSVSTGKVSLAKDSVTPQKKPMKRNQCAAQYVTVPLNREHHGQTTGTRKNTQTKGCISSSHFTEKFIPGTSTHLTDYNMCNHSQKIDVQSHRYMDHFYISEYRPHFCRKLCCHKRD